jgi:hypothetical protein
MLTFSTPGTSMAWMPANPWVSRLQQKIAKYLENHDKVFWSWPSNPESGHLQE